LVASWYPFASDYSRYLPPSSRTAAVTLWPVAGVAVPMVLLGLFGLLLPTIDAKLASDQGVLAVIHAHAPAWVALPFFIFVAAGARARRLVDGNGSEPIVRQLREPLRQCGEQAELFQRWIGRRATRGRPERIGQHRGGRRHLLGGKASSVNLKAPIALTIAGS